MWKSFLGLIRQKLNFLAPAQSADLARNPIIHIISSSVGSEKLVRVEGKMEEAKYRGNPRRKSCCSLQETVDWDEGSPFRKPMTLRTP